MRKRLVWLMLLTLALCLCGCSGLESSQPQPDLRLLERPVYEDEAVPAAESDAGDGVLRVDLWLDASQTMGGVNQNETSIYPHHSRKYREGGFHYRFGNTVGQYETVLRCMLSAAEGSRVRVLRCGNERLPDEYLIAEGLADASATADTLRSLRRDLLTCAVDPMPTVFSEFSGEKMENSFYALGSPMLSRIDSIPAAVLENPAKADDMAALLQKQTAAIADGSDDRLTAIGDDTDYPLLYALRSIDLTRLSVITCDPASVRRLTAVSADGSPVALVERVLEERGVFDAGLSVGLYAFTLDYMGQMSSFASADLSEPLVWGHLKYNSKKKLSEAALPMPRIMLTLVIGPQAQVDAYTSALSAQLDASAVLRELRGPEKGELSYTRDGQTVTQQPFSFSYEYLQINRPALGSSTHHTSGLALTASCGQVDAATRLVTLSAGEESRLTLTVPNANTDAALTDLSLTVEDALLLSRTLPNTADAQTQADEQVIALRDRLYVFAHQDAPDADLSLTGAQADGGALVFSIRAGAGLAPGYYHLCLSADYADGSVAWQTPAWVEEWNAEITNEQIASWAGFTQLITQYEGKRSSIPRAFQHAWGPAADNTYHGTAYPDFPPVYKAPGLSELVRQLQSAADVEQTPCLRYEFDLFVTNR